MATDNPVTEAESRSPEETAAVAVSLLPLIRRAGCASLEGPLGAGKTHFVKALASALGITTPVSSPTFTLLHSYEGGECPLHHSDWYRLESEGEVAGLALEEYLGDGLLIIEWGDKFPTQLPPGTLRIAIKQTGPDTRRISWNGDKA